MHLKKAHLEMSLKAKGKSTNRKKQTRIKTKDKVRAKRQGKTLSHIWSVRPGVEPAVRDIRFVGERLNHSATEAPQQYQ